MLGVLKPENAIIQSQSLDMCTACDIGGASLEFIKYIGKDVRWTELSQAPAGDDSHPPKDGKGEHYVSTLVKALCSQLWVLQTS